MKVFKENEHENERIIKEVDILQSLNHQNIIKYRTHFQSHQKLCIIMDFASGIELYKTQYIYRWDT